MGIFSYEPGGQFHLRITDEVFDEARRLASSPDYLRELKFPEELVCHEAPDFPVREILAVFVTAYDREEERSGIPHDARLESLELRRKERLEFEHFVARYNSKQERRAAAKRAAWEQASFGETVFRVAARAAAQGVARAATGKAEDVRWFEKTFANYICGDSVKAREFLLEYARAFGGRDEALCDLAGFIRERFTLGEFVRRSRNIVPVQKRAEPSDAETPSIPPASREPRESSDVGSRSDNSPRSFASMGRPSSAAPAEPVAAARGLWQQYGDQVVVKALELANQAATLGKTCIADDARFKATVNDPLWQMVPLPLRLFGRNRLRWDSLLFGIRDSVFIIEADRVYLHPETKQRINTALTGALGRDFRATSPESEKPSLGLEGIEGESSSAVCIIEQARLAGHQDSVLCLCFSPDGCTLASCGSDRTVILWDVRNGTEQHRFEAHAFGVSAMSYSPDGKLLITGGQGGDPTVRLWNASTLEKVRSIYLGTPAPGIDRFACAEGERHDDIQGSHDLWGGKVTSLSVSPDSSRLAISTDSKTFCVLSLSDRDFYHEYRGHQQRVFDCVYSTDGQYLLTGGFDNTVRLWESNTGREIHCYVGHTEAVRRVAIAPDARLAASASFDKSVRVWSLSSGSEVRRLVTADEALCIAFVPDTDLVVAGNGGGQLEVWDLQTGTQTGRISIDNHSGSVLAIAASPDGGTIGAGVGHTVGLWRLQQRVFPSIKSAGVPGKANAASAIVKSSRNVFTQPLIAESVGGSDNVQVGATDGTDVLSSNVERREDCVSSREHFGSSRVLARPDDSRSVLSDGIPASAAYRGSWRVQGLVVGVMVILGLGYLLLSMSNRQRAEQRGPEAPVRENGEARSARPEVRRGAGVSDSAPASRVSAPNPDSLPASTLSIATENASAAAGVSTSPVAVYEAESAELIGSAKFNREHPGYSGSGYIDGYGFQGLGSTTTFRVNVDSPGDYVVGLRYANAMGRLMTISVHVNGRKVMQTVLSPLTSWAAWAEKREVLALNSGANTIAYRYDPGDSGNINIDLIRVEGFPTRARQ
jgi:WD40 repeat protein